MDNKDYNLTVPITLSIFKRESKTRRTINLLRRVRPQNIFVVSDGPRTKEEKKEVESTRAVIEEIDWECKINKFFFEENNGGPVAIPAGLNWVFQQVDRTIFIEDDVIFSTKFLFFAQELLEYYKNDNRIGTIGSRNKVGYRPENNESYFFHILPLTGGCFALWKRSWDIFRRKVVGKNNYYLDKQTIERFSNKKYLKEKIKIFEQLEKKKIPNWDLHFEYCFLNNGYLSIVPKYNQAYKDGFDNAAQHSSVRPIIQKERAIEYDLFPIVHPKIVVANKEFEKKDYKRKYGLINKFEKSMKKLRKSNLFSRFSSMG